MRTDGVNPTVKTEGLVVQVKKPCFECAREIFAMVDEFEPDCLGGGIRIMAAGTGKALGYNCYAKYLMANNDYHNNTRCITLLGYHPLYRDVTIAVGDSATRKVYKHLADIDGVMDVVETKDSQMDGKYFVIVDSSKMAPAEFAISQVLGALTDRLRNPMDEKVVMKYREYPSLKSGITAGGYIAQSAARFAGEFDNTPLTSSSIRQHPKQKMSFTIDDAAQFPQIQTKQLAWKQPKDDVTIDSMKSHRSTTDVTEVSLALTLQTFESKMTTSILQIIDNAREDQKATRAADELREERRNAERAEERAEDQRIRAEERLQTQTMLNMLMPLIQNAAQHQSPPNQLLLESDGATDTKRLRTSETIVMDIANNNPLPPKGGNQH